MHPPEVVDERRSGPVGRSIRTARTASASAPTATWTGFASDRGRMRTRRRRRGLGGTRSGIGYGRMGDDGGFPGGLVVHLARLEAGLLGGLLEQGPALGRGDVVGQVGVPRRPDGREQGRVEPGLEQDRGAQRRFEKVPDPVVELEPFAECERVFERNPVAAREGSDVIEGGLGRRRRSSPDAFQIPRAFEDDDPFADVLQRAVPPASCQADEVEHLCAVDVGVVCVSHFSLPSVVVVFLCVIRRRTTDRLDER